jgi:hypothetical protein
MKNLTASVRTRLLNLSRESGEPLDRSWSNMRWDDFSTALPKVNTGIALF